MGKDPRLADSVSIDPEDKTVRVGSSARPFIMKNFSADTSPSLPIANFRGAPHQHMHDLNLRL
jgi:hypothetical protein